jgi:membrane-associated protein
MSYPRFLLFSVLGACLWVAICVTAGYFLASVPFVQNHFELVVLAIVFISVLPMAIEYLRHRREARGFDVAPAGVSATKSTPAE